MQRADLSALCRDADARHKAEVNRRLEIADELLWRLDSSGGCGPASAAACTSSALDSVLSWLSAATGLAAASPAWLQTVAHCGMALILQATSLTACNTSVLMYQDTIPGPWQPGTCRQPLSGY